MYVYNIEDKHCTGQYQIHDTCILYFIFKWKKSINILFPKYTQYVYYTNGVQNNDRTCTAFNITLYVSLCNYENVTYLLIA